MSTTAPADGGTNPHRMKEKIEEKLKHPFHEMREKFRDTRLYDLKVSLVNKKYVESTVPGQSIKMLISN